MKQFSEIIVLGASKKATVPFDDFNLWLDPEAAAIVLAAGIPTTLVTVEAQEQFVLSQTELNELTKHGNPVAKLIAEPMKYFLETMTGFTGEVGTSFADVVGAMVAVELDIIKNSENALVKIDTGYRLARGQTYIGNNFADKLMLAVTEETLNEWATKAFNGSDFNLEQEVFTALAREPENALVITEVDQVRMKAVFMATLCSYLNI
jgi:inosine-uridine nucleoside N-ribohydrolase